MIDDSDEHTEANSAEDMLNRKIMTMAVLIGRDPDRIREDLKRHPNLDLDHIYYPYVPLTS